MGKRYSTPIRSVVGGMALAIAGLGITATTASAGTACTDTIEDSVLANDGCEVGNTNNDFLNPLQVNIDSMFDGGWSFLAKDNDLNGTDEGTTAALSVSGNTMSGNWTINEPYFSGLGPVEFMIVLKGGKEDYVGWLISTMSGSYTTPFFNPNNGNGKDISHLSLYSRAGGDPITPPVPLPAAAWFLLSGAGALGAVRMRGRKS